MSMRTLGALVVTAACALASPAMAQEQETGAVSASASASGPRYSSSRGRNVGKLRINGGLHFGGGGEVEQEVEGFGGETDIDLDPLVGLQAGVDYILMEYFALGGELRLTWWRPDEILGAEVDRSMFFDLNVKPRGRYQFDRFPLEVYGTLPMGLSVAAMNDDTGLDTGAGFNLGFGGGATYFFTSLIGVNAELLGVWHWFDADTDAGNLDTDNRTAQFYFLLNAVFAL